MGLYHNLKQSRVGQSCFLAAARRAFHQDIKQRC